MSHAMSHAMSPRVRRLRTRTAASLRGHSPVDTEATAVLHRAAQVLVDDLAGLTGRLVAALRAQEPAYRAALETDADEVWQEIHRSLRYNVGSLIRPRECRDAALRTSWQIGENRAEQGLPLEAVQHAFRLGGAMVWQDLVDETARYDPDDVRLLVHVAADVWNFVDEHCGVVAEAYRRTERHLVWRRENRLRLMTAALLDGTLRITDLPDAAAMLDLPEHGRYAVIAAAGVHPARMALPPGTRAIRHTSADEELAVVLLDDAPEEGVCDGPLPYAPGPARVGTEASGGSVHGASLVLARGEGRAAGGTGGGSGDTESGRVPPVHGRPVRVARAELSSAPAAAGSSVRPSGSEADRGPAQGHDGARTARGGPRPVRGGTGPGPAVPGALTPAGLAALLTAPMGVRVGVSSAVTGLAAVGDARRLAGTALRACPRGGGVVLLDDHLPAALVVSSPALGTALAERVLGPLDGVDPADRELLVETLTVWLDEDGSAQRAAARLYCHRNTVLNRLRRFEQLTGRLLSRPSDAVEVSLALAARRLLDS
ncbi:helix-turn-helix domain-containing protein [Streptomyces sp. NPDC006208]|uniref:PucR family transcriptional regulator n=1 Tax=Streptomyces sp. NPDC006208 TaxID=3156734 RepID=UPI0033A44701